MFHGQAENDRNLTAPLPAPRYVAWWVWSGVGFLGMGAAFGWSMASSSNKGWTGPRLTLLIVCVLLLYLLWRATRAWLAYKPGAVDVQQLEDATSACTPKPSAVDLTAKLRQRLSDSSMYPPTTLPAQAPPESFLELLGDVEIDPKKLGSALPRILSRLRPKLAYRVGGVLQFRDTESDPYGMTVTVTAFLFGGSRATTIWASDWDDVIRKAGSWVVSTLLPVTRAGRLPPWRRWWGRELNPELYEAYQEANELSRAGRHHEALERYFTAVRLDPKNPYLRAELAETQEKMRLHIDALDTCQRALVLDGQDVHSYAERLWSERHRLRYFRHPRRFRELLGLRYRNSIILGTAEVTAKQWCNDEGANSKETRVNLAPLLAQRYWRSLFYVDNTRIPNKQDAQNYRELLSRILKGGKDETLIRLVFQLASWQETSRLARDNTWAQLWLYLPAWLWSRARLAWPAAYYQSVRGPRFAATRGAFQVNRKVWAPLRLMWASWDYSKWRLPREWEGPDTCLSETKIRWSRLNVDDLDDELRSAAGISRGDWLTNYNMACAYAVAMRAESPDPDFQRKLAERAVKHLEKAALTSGESFKSFAVVERTWLAYEDPDLAPLREKETRANELFDDFVRTAYPRAEALEQHPPHGQPDDQLREYDYRLLEEIAKVMQQVWNERSEKADVDIQCATEWLRVERKIWRFIHEISDSANKRRWQGRVSLIRYIQANCQPTSSSSPGFPPPLVPDEDASPNGHRDPKKIVRTLAVLTHDMGRTHASARWRVARATPYSNSQKGQGILREAAADGVARLDARTVRALSTGYAAAWQTLDDWLEGEVKHSPFRQAARHVPRLTRRPPWGTHGKRKLPI
ncbi:tetratricopeptide repeat protein [Streptomyces inhibens]|uniref:tetratricopeptide repeat protein n=1 Tax=Streptomyces inhibens TaxID=2293571 RepID=UPI003677F8A2